MVALHSNGVEPLRYERSMKAVYAIYDNEIAKGVLDIYFANREEVKNKIFNELNK